jgi:short-subunit dehydrogenase
VSEKFYFHNKNYVVTGVSSGLGFAISEKLLKSGASVIGVSRSFPIHHQKLLDLANENKFKYFKADVSLESNCIKLGKYLQANFTDLHGLIHCAGVGIRGSAMDIQSEVFSHVMNTNFMSLVYLYKEVQNNLSNSNGNLTVISSMQGLIPLPNRSAYSVSKNAVAAFMENLRLENDSIHFLTIFPGYIQTEFSVNALTKQGQKTGIKDKTTEKGMVPQKVARIILKTIQTNKTKLIIAGWKEYTALYIYRFFPKLFERFIKKYY